MNDHFEFNGMGNNTPNANGGMPPLTPHKPKPKPTPTIPQMEDRHERQVFADKAMKWLHRIACWLGGVAISMFAVSLLLRAVVGVY
jgi:hypothetical protein